MAAIEFTSNPGKTFLVSVRNPQNNYSLLASNIACTEVTTARYRASLGSLTGLVWIEAVAGATRTVGFADLDVPAANGYSDVIDAALENKINFSVLPGRDRSVPSSEAGEIVVYVNEIVTIARSVVDGNGNPMDLSVYGELQFVVEDARGINLDTSAVTIAGVEDDTYSFETTSAMTNRLGVFDYSLNEVGGARICGGKWIVRRRAL